MKKVTLFGNELHLEGNQIEVGQKAPDFTVLDKDLKPVKLSDFSGKIKLISVTPSLDTPVCDMQARTFNEKASQLSQDIVILNISMDLPFAIGRFCTAANIDRVITLSDHKDASFGLNYGLLIKELRLLTRAIIVIDKNDFIRYIEIVPEVTNHPNYDKALEAVKGL